MEPNPALGKELKDAFIEPRAVGASSGSGAVLASPEDVRSDYHTEQCYRLLEAKAYVSAVRRTQGWVVPLIVFVPAALALVGYPRWRALALAAAFAATLTWRSVFWGRLGQDAVSETVRVVPRFLLTLFALALTGGVCSPLLPTILIPFSDLVVGSGWSRMVKAMIALVGAGLLAMAVLPAPWFGPQVPYPAYWIILLATVSIGAACHIRYVLTLTDTICENAAEIERARDAVIQRANTRAHDMEQLAAKLSHELKNPLAAIKGLVQLSARAAPDPDSREQLSVVAAEVDRMEGILKEYLSFSRPLDALKPQRIALGALADEVLSTVEARAASAGVEVRRRGDVLVEADPRRLKEALFNLVGNALDATSGGGVVEVQIEEADERARIAVRDTGRGMPPEVLERLGTPFFTTRDEGTGLGVVVARAVFARHGGSLLYTSAPGRGTTALGILPLRNSQRSSDVTGATG